jgi:uncharacterized protein YndB with AHSA1/START domain
VVIGASPDRVWDGLTKPEIVKQWLYGVEVISDWKKDSPVIYRGEWDGKPYEDKGTILEIEKPSVLRATYYSPLSGLEDRPENYNVVSYVLEPSGEGTKVTCTQTNCQTQEAADQAEKNWRQSLEKLKALLEA